MCLHRSPTEINSATLFLLCVAANVADDTHPSSVGTRACQKVWPTHLFVTLKTRVETTISTAVVGFTQHFGLQASELAFLERALDVVGPAAGTAVCKADFFFHALGDKFGIPEKHEKCASSRVTSERCLGLAHNLHVLTGAALTALAAVGHLVAVVVCFLCRWKCCDLITSIHSTDIVGGV